MRKQHSAREHHREWSTEGSSGWGLGCEVVKVNDTPRGPGQCLGSVSPPPPKLTPMAVWEGFLGSRRPVAPAGLPHPPIITPVSCCDRATPLALTAAASPLASPTPRTPQPVP